MKAILTCMMIDPYFSLLALGQFISYIGFGYVCIKLCKRLMIER